MLTYLYFVCRFSVNINLRIQYLYTLKMIQLKFITIYLFRIYGELFFILHTTCIEHIPRVYSNNKMHSISKVATYLLIICLDILHDMNENTFRGFIPFSREVVRYKVLVNSDMTITLYTFCIQNINDRNDCTLFCIIH